MSAQAWRRHPMLLLVFGLPAAAVVAAIATLLIAMSGPGDSGDRRVHRVAQTQTADLAPDRAAARLALRAEALLGEAGAVTIRVEGKAPRAPALQLDLRHVTDPRRDRRARLVHAGDGVYLGRLDAARANGDYNVELVPLDGGWRLVARLGSDRAALVLRPALED
jgi:uncharacterized protein